MESVDMDDGDTDRLFTFEVAKTNEQEESAITRPGFQVSLLCSLHKSISDLRKMYSRYLSRYEAPPDSLVDPAIFAPHLLPGETTQGFFTATYLPPTDSIDHFERRSFSKMSLKKLL
jgi:hypothetical protein